LVRGSHEAGQGVEALGDAHQPSPPLAQSMPPVLAAPRPVSRTRSRESPAATASVTEPYAPVTAPYSPTVESTSPTPPPTARASSALSHTDRGPRRDPSVSPGSSGRTASCPWENPSRNRALWSRYAVVVLYRSPGSRSSARLAHVSRD